MRSDSPPPSYYEHHSYRDEAPSALFTRERTVRATRKAHVCWECDREIPAGSRAVSFARRREEAPIETGHRHPYRCISDEGELL